MSDDEAAAEPPVDTEPALLHGVPITLSPARAAESGQAARAAESGQGGQLVAHPARESYLDLIQALSQDGYQMAVDLCGADYLVNPARVLPPGVAGERFEVVVNLLSFSRHARVRVRVQVPESDPRLPSLFDLHPGTEAMERETYDLYGIVFEGHPDLTRILMPDDWEGHPLRKDFGIGRIPVQFKAPRSNAT